MDPPAGTVAFLFTDIVGSTEQWETDRKRMREALERHDEAVRAAVEVRKGYVFKHTGDGFCAAFLSSSDAVRAAIEAHRRLQRADWPDGRRLRVRMSIHVGQADFHNGDYFGPALNRASRLLTVTGADQVLLTDVARRALSNERLDGASTSLLGSFRLKGLSAPLRAYVLRHPDLPEADESPAAIRNPRKRKHNLEADDRPFVGRKAELTNLRHRFLVERQRLVTITGMGGMGKTRLAREFARSAAGEFPDGAWFVECDALGSRDEIASMVLASVGSDSAGSDPEEALEKHLFKKDILLVLDCFEGVAEHATLVDNLLKKCPGISALVTSRVVLNLPREHEVSLVPMTESSGAFEGDAVALFAEGASHVVDGFELTRKTRRIVSQIVERVEGVPLCIVLAASRLRYVSLEDLAGMLEAERLDVLRRKTTGADKHARIVDVIEGSLSFLSQSERTLFSELSVFVGGFTRQDAHAVCGRTVDAELEALRDHSLVVLASSGERTRYKMLDTLRDYARSKLDAEELQSLRERHASRYAEAAGSIREASELGNWERASEQLRTELGNLRAGVAFAVSHRMHQEVRAYAFALCRSFFEAGFWSEFDALSDAAVHTGESLNDDALSIMALGLRGAMERRKGHESEAKKLWMERLEICERSGRHENTADTLIDLSIQAHEGGDDQAAEEYLERAGLVAGSCGNRALLATVDIARVHLMIKRNDRSGAESIALRLAELKPDSASADYWMFVFGSLGRVFLQLDRPQDAVRTLVKSLRIALDAERLFAAGFTLLHLGRALAMLSCTEAAYSALLAASKLHAELRSKLRAESTKEFRAFKRASPKFDQSDAAARLRAQPWRALCTHALDLARAI